MFLFNHNDYIGETKTVTINPKGWNGPLDIEYGVAQANQFDTMSSIVWHVVGTRHYFSIYEPYMAKYAKSGYAAHFTEVLENFREDYLSWWEQAEYDGCEWRDEYKREFGAYIKGRETDQHNRRRY